ncbi:glycosyltransferase [Methylacidiphilum kamchatkense]|nr:glycosyltransferase [Methylacidiphilum kamchatkense]QDQ42892.1 glycosyltransferase involved in cell wall biosynthesis [Methylacidiphilum kamchatkense Kam1]
MKPFHIAFVIPSIDHKSGGPSAAIAFIAKTLLDLGHKVTLLTTDKNIDPKEGGMIELDPQVDLRIFPLKGKINQKLIHSPHLVFWLKQHISQFNLLDIHSIWSLITSQSAKIALQNNIPYIFTPHGMTSRWDFNKHPLAKSFFYFFHFKKQWEKANAIRFVTEKEKNDCILPINSFCAIIPYFIEIPKEILEEKPKAIINEIILPKNDPVLLFLGRIDAQKGVIEMLQAFDYAWRQNPKIHFFVVGPSSGIYGQKAYCIYQSLQSKSHIHWLGPVYGKDKWYLFKRADIFITLSKNEGLPIAVVEALGMGKPVIVTRECNIFGLDRYGCGIYVNDNPEEVASSLLLLIENNERLLEMGKKARHFYESHYSQEVVSQKLIDFYFQIIRNK